jgi:hypothetical protein
MATKAQLQAEMDGLLKERKSANAKIKKLEQTVKDLPNCKELQRKYDQLVTTRSKPKTVDHFEPLATSRLKIIDEHKNLLRKQRDTMKYLNNSLDTFKTNRHAFVNLSWWKRLTMSDADVQFWLEYGEDI